MTEFCPYCIGAKILPIYQVGEILNPPCAAALGVHCAVVDIEEHSPGQELGGQYLLCCNTPPLCVVRVSESLNCQN